MHETLVTFHHCFFPKTKTQPHLPPILTATSLTLPGLGPGILGAVWVILWIRGWMSGHSKIASYKSVDRNYYKRVKANHLTNPLQQFTHRSLHSKLYTNFTHYLHLPCPLDLVATWCHHFHLCWLLHTVGACCSSSSWLKTQNTRNVHIYMLTSTNATHNSSHSSHIALLTYWSQSVLGIYKQKRETNC